MPSPTPFRYGQTCHIYNRGNDRENISFWKRKTQHFLRLYSIHIEPTGDTYGYCLQRNHYHFLVWVKTEQEKSEMHETGGASGLAEPFRAKSLSQQFSNLLNAYAKSTRKAAERTRSLLLRPFGRVRVASETHFVFLIAFVHQDPQRHGLVDNLGKWPHPSYPAILSTKPTSLKRDDVLAWFHGRSEFQVSHRMQVQDRQTAAFVPHDS